MKVPVYDIRNCGPRHRFGANGKLVSNCNWQNFKRGSDIRKAICAPEGQLLVVADLAQIECRILCYLAGQHDYVEKFAKGEDPYIGMASKAYGFAVTKENQKERGTGKQLVLSCGYQAGAATIQNTARLGTYGPSVSIDLATADSWKRAYRKEFWAVVRYWKEADGMIPVLANGGSREWGPMTIHNKKIYGPGGAWLNYSTLARRVEPETGEQLWQYWTRRYGWTKLYSGKLVENLTQWLARIVLSQAMMQLRKLGYRIVTCTHDEVVIIVDNDGRQDYHAKRIEKEMSRTPDWLPGLPLGCEIGIGERYSK